MRIYFRKFSSKKHDFKTELNYSWIIRLFQSKKKTAWLCTNGLVKRFFMVWSTEKDITRKSPYDTTNNLLFCLLLMPQKRVDHIVDTVAAFFSEIVDRFCPCRCIDAQLCPQDIRQKQIGGNLQGIGNADECFELRHFFAAFNHPRVGNAEPDFLREDLLTPALFLSASTDSLADTCSVPGFTTF